MPLRWEIHHAEKLIHIVAEGKVTLKEMEEHFDALVVADVLSYALLTRRGPDRSIATTT
jgi:hypothetical protein